MRPPVTEPSPGQEKLERFAASLSPREQAAVGFLVEQSRLAFEETMMEKVNDPVWSGADGTGEDVRGYAGEWFDLGYQWSRFTYWAGHQGGSGAIHTTTPVNPGQVASQGGEVISQNGNNFLSKTKL